MKRLREYKYARVFCWLYSTGRYVYRKLANLTGFQLIKVDEERTVRLSETAYVKQGEGMACRVREAWFNLTK